MTKKTRLLRSAIALTTPAPKSSMVDTLMSSIIEAARQTAHRKSPHQIEREKHEARELEIVERSVRAMVEEAGSPVVVEKVEIRYGEVFDVTLLQWRSYGVGGLEKHELRLPRKTYMQVLSDEKIDRMVRGRFARLIGVQADHAATRGTARLFKPDEVDLSHMEIERPLAAALRERYGSKAGMVLRRLAIGDRSALYDRGDETIEGRSGSRKQLVENIDVDFARTRVRGSFTTEAQGVGFVWSKGGLTILEAPLPDVVLTGCTGQRFGSLIEHRLFDGDMRITSQTAVSKQGRAGVALTMKDFMQPMPAQW